MSMGMVLEGVRDWLRERNGWSNIQCGVTDNAEPPARPGQFYIGIDEESVDLGPDNTHGLTETYSIVVAVWRRPGHLPKDFTGDMVFPEDKYLPEISTLHDLERRVTFWLHAKWELRTYLDAKYQLPDTGRGDRFNGCLMATGRGGREFFVLNEGTYFHGRRLRFRGLKRIQKITSDLG